MHKKRNMSKENQNIEALQDNEIEQLMEDYRESAKDLLFKAYGTREISEIPLATFEDRDKICFSKIRGSVRLMNEMVMTTKEAEAYIERVLKLKLP